MIDTILIPLDGSELSERAIPWARLIGGERASYHLLRAFTVPSSTLFPGVAAIASLKVARVIDEYLESKREALDSAHTTLSTECGPAAGSILRRADSINADLIVLSSHGEGGKLEWLMGSVATKVLRGARRPVLVVKVGAESSPPLLKRILVGVDGSELAEHAVEKAAELCREHQGELVIYQGLAFQQTGSPTDWEEYRQSSIAEARSYLRGLAERTQGITVRTEARDSTPGHGILDAAVDLSCDLVVVGSHGRSGISRWVLGSVAENVVQKSRVPVLVVHQDD
jgi:nucleotide-binding universal stress UspA family protein